jgi:hypothetical protein
MSVMTLAGLAMVAVDSDDLPRVTERILPAENNKENTRVVEVDLVKKPVTDKPEGLNTDYR